MNQNIRYMVFFAKYIMKTEKTNLIHIKYEITNTFYQVVHENCNENHNF